MSKNQPDIVVRFEPETLAQILASVHNCNVEISGLATVTREENLFKVSGDVVIPEQTCSLSATDPDHHVLNLHFNRISMSGTEAEIEAMSKQKLWWHSHVWMSTFFSAIDRGTMINLLSGLAEWWLVLVANKRNQICLALIEKMGQEIRYREVPISFSREMTSREFKTLIEKQRASLLPIIKSKITIMKNPPPLRLKKRRRHG